MKIWFDYSRMSGNLILYISLPFSIDVIEKLFVYLIKKKRIGGHEAEKVLAFNETLCKSITEGDTIIHSDQFQSLFIQYKKPLRIEHLLKYPSDRFIKEILQDPQYLELRYIDETISYIVESLLGCVELNVNYKELNKGILSKNLEELRGVKEKITWQLGKLVSE